MTKKAKAQQGFDPYLVRDPYSMAKVRWLVLGRTHWGVYAVGKVVYMPGTQVGVVDRVIQDWHLKNYPRCEEESSCASLIQDIKSEMLTHGATSMAVQWVSEYSPFSEKELNAMAEKLKTKAAKSGGKGPRPVGTPTKAAAKNKGNPEALAKAREAGAAKRTESHARKLKILVKAKDSGLRGGRLAKLKALEDAKPKTVGEALGITCVDEGGKEHVIDMGSLSGMAKRQHIEIG